jgi:hypothetical protein
VYLTKIGKNVKKELILSVGVLGWILACSKANEAQRASDGKNNREKTS